MEAGLKQGAKLPEQIVPMGVGWLAREGKLRLVRKSKTVKLDLRQGRAHD